MVYFDYFCLEIKRKHPGSLFSFNLVGIFFLRWYYIVECKTKENIIASLLFEFLLWIKIMKDTDKNVTDSNVLNLYKDDEAHLWIASYFLKKDMNENKEKNVVERSSMKDRRKGRKTSRKCLWTIEWLRFSWILSGVGNTEITSDFFFEGKWMERCHLRYISRETSIRRETSCFASFWIFFLKK